MSTITWVCENTWFVVWHDNRDDGTGEVASEYVDDAKAYALLACHAVRRDDVAEYNSDEISRAEAESWHAEALESRRYGRL